MLSDTYNNIQSKNKHYYWVFIDCAKDYTAARCSHLAQVLTITHSDTKTWENMI